MAKKVKQPKFNVGDTVYKNFLKTKTPYKITKRQWRDAPENTWVYKVNGKHWSESNLTKYKKPRK